MDAVFPLRRPRPLIWIAFFAWFAQLCLPAAHAAVMARHDAGLPGWCGSFSPAMAAKVAALPADIRDIIAPGADAHASAMQAECLLLCAGTMGAVLPAAAWPAATPTALAVERVVAVAEADPRPLPSLRPPPRGPPPSA